MLDKRLACLTQQLPAYDSRPFTVLELTKLKIKFGVQAHRMYVYVYIYGRNYIYINETEE
jgi:hypothetical protein